MRETLKSWLFAFTRKVGCLSLTDPFWTEAHLTMSWNRSLKPSFHWFFSGETSNERGICDVLFCGLLSPAVGPQELDVSNNRVGLFGVDALAAVLTGYAML